MPSEALSLPNCRGLLPSVITEVAVLISKLKTECQIGWHLPKHPKKADKTRSVTYTLPKSARVRLPPPNTHQQHAPQTRTPTYSQKLTHSQALRSRLLWIGITLTGFPLEPNQPSPCPTPPPTHTRVSPTPPHRVPRAPGLTHSPHVGAPRASSAGWGHRVTPDLQRSERERTRPRSLRSQPCGECSHPSSPLSPTNPRAGGDGPFKTRPSRRPQRGAQRGLHDPHSVRPPTSSRLTSGRRAPPPRRRRRGGGVRAGSGGGGRPADGGAAVRSLRPQDGDCVGRGRS